LRQVGDKLYAQVPSLVRWKAQSAPAGIHLVHPRGESRMPRPPTHCARSPSSSARVLLVAATFCSQRDRQATSASRPRGVTDKTFRAGPTGLALSTSSTNP
jgi:hypothetical protein